MDLGSQVRENFVSGKQGRMFHATESEKEEEA